MFLQIETDSISPGAYIFQRPFLRGLLFGGAYIWRGLCKEGNLRFKTDWANLIVGSKFTVFALFYFVFESNFPSTSSPRGGGGAYIWRGDLTEDFFALPVWGGGGLYLEGLIFGTLRYQLSGGTRKKFTLCIVLKSNIAL